MVLISFKLDYGFICPYFSIVKRWLFYVNVSLCTTYDVRCMMMMIIIIIIIVVVVVKYINVVHFVLI